MSITLVTGEPWLRQADITAFKAGLHREEARDWTEVSLDGETLAARELLQHLGSDDLFASNRLIHLRRADRLSDEATRALVGEVQRSLPPSRLLLVEAAKLDRRSTLYKVLAERAQVRDHPAPNRRELPGVVKRLLDERDLKLDQRSFRTLLESVSDDLARLGREVEKLALYAAGGAPITPEVLSGLLFHDKGGDLFDALDAWLGRRPDAAYRLGQLLDGGEDPGKLFYLLAGQVRALLRVRSLMDHGATNEEIAKRSGEWGWLVAKRRRVAQALSVRELAQYLHRLHREDLLVKRGERTLEASLWTLLLEWLYRPIAPATTSS